LEELNGEGPGALEQVPDGTTGNHTIVPFGPLSMVSDAAMGCDVDYEGRARSECAGRLEDLNGRHVFGR
jgi:hypothetical protein